MTSAERRAAIVSTGNEILQGQYADTNARFLAEKLTLLGYRVIRIVAVGDEQEDLAAILRELRDIVDLVVCTGGLGPTVDDRNRDVLAAFHGVALHIDEAALKSMRERFRTRGYGEMPVSNEVQARIPDGATVFSNQWGTAPGFYLSRKDESIGRSPALIALPGPPSEMIPMFTECAGPLLESLSAGQVTIGKIRTIKTFGHPESEINEKVRDLFDRDPQTEFTILAKPYGVELRICRRGRSLEEIAAGLDEYEKLVRMRLNQGEIYGIDDDTMAVAVARLLLDAEATVATAESCTGGLVARLLTDVSGSSGYLNESHVTYSNEAKQRILGVREETLRQYGAVSEQTAREMAEGVRAISGATFGLATTGISGPGGGTADKPVGLTFMAVATPDSTRIIRERFLGNRSQNRRQTALTILDMLRKSFEL